MEILHIGGVYIVWWEEEIFHIEEITSYRLKVVSFTIVEGWKKLYVFWAYVPPNYLPVMHQFHRENARSSNKTQLQSQIGIFLGQGYRTVNSNCITENPSRKNGDDRSRSVSTATGKYRYQVTAVDEANRRNPHSLQCRLHILVDIGGDPPYRWGLYCLVGGGNISY